LRQPVFLAFAQTPSRRIRVTGLQVNELYPFQLPGPVNLVQQGFQSRRIQAFRGVEREVARAHAKAAQYVEVDEIGRFLNQNNVSRVAQHLRRQGERLLRAVGDKETIANSGRFFRQLVLINYPVGQQLAQSWTALV